MIKFSMAMYSPMLWSKWYAQNICNALPEIVEIDKSITIYTMMWILCVLWLVIAHDISEYRYMDDVTRNLFCLFCSTWCGLKMFVRLFWLKASEILKKVQQELFARKKNGEMGTKRALDYVRMPKLQEIFTTAAIVFHRYERLAVLQNVFAIILLWARKDIEKLFKETV